MCGIFAYIGTRQVLSLLITALKRLEYRGYDSAGVAVHGNPLKLRKKEGKVSNLEGACGSGDLEGTCGMAHTRWATHGKPSDVNSHPHVSQDKSVAVVHNGVIENYQALRQQLTNKGYEFVSETDTELIAHLVYDIRQDMPKAKWSWSQVVAVALQRLEGAYGLVFIFQDEEDLLIGARKGSPLVLGVGQGEHMLASDASAIIEHTKDVVYIDEGQLVEVRRSGYKTFSVSDIFEKTSKKMEQDVEKARHESPRVFEPGAILDNPIVRLEMSLEQLEKGGYPHFMLKEIMDQPRSLRNAMRGRIYSTGDSTWQIKLGGLNSPLDECDGKSVLERMAAAKRIIICACGTSWHSGLIGKYAMESLAEIPVEVEYASEFRYRRPLISKEDVIVAISQSGETADTLEAIRIAKAHGALTIGLVNVVGSSIARDTVAGAYLHAGPEIGVASTKAFTCQVVAMIMISLQLGSHRGVISQDELTGFCESLNSVPDLIEGWLEPLNKQVHGISKYLRLASTCLFCGCGAQFPVALEGALKLKEISYIHAEGFTAAEIRHAPTTLIKGFMPVFIIAMTSDPAYKHIKEHIFELGSKDAAIIVITDQGNDDFKQVASFVIHCPATKVELQPLLSVVPLQLLSYHIADMRGCSIDQPRNLAKSVTVE
jgi:glucosamine--fructose-6-phosphate aminotransferase (isomerizing)